VLAGVVAQVRVLEVLEVLGVVVMVEGILHL
jgi:hypothetical protein